MMLDVNECDDKMNRMKRWFPSMLTQMKGQDQAKGAGILKSYR